jgi:hypothetical protein
MHPLSHAVAEGPGKLECSMEQLDGFVHLALVADVDDTVARQDEQEAI